MKIRNIERSKGFNLIEAMVALVVISVGMLGIAKMQALALASTGTAKIRSLAAIQAASLASTVRADRAYWSAITNTVTVGFLNGAVAATDGALTVSPNCLASGGCTAVSDMTAFDLKDWATSIAAQMPNQSSLVCTGPATATVPVTCKIQINWSENRVAVNTQSAAELPLATQYTLYVEP
jgi:type IV pilus assembly protein PilV